MVNINGDRRGAAWSDTLWTFAPIDHYLIANKNTVKGKQSDKSFKMCLKRTNHIVCAMRDSGAVQASDISQAEL
jgi:hypothetical protein